MFACGSKSRLHNVNGKALVGEVGIIVVVNAVKVHLYTEGAEVCVACSADVDAGEVGCVVEFPSVLREGLGFCINCFQLGPSNL